MTKYDFIELGVDEELAGKCEEASGNELRNFVPVALYDELDVSKTKLCSELEERNSQLECLRNSNEDITSLKETIANLQADNKAKEENFTKEMHKLKLDNAVESALRLANAINPKTVLPLLENMDFAEFDESGAVVGLDAQLKNLASNEDTKFLFNAKTKPNIMGATIGESGNDEAEKPTSYASISKMLQDNPNLVI